MSATDATQLSPVKRAFLAIQALQSRVDELELARSEPIAIVGLACRFPRAANPDAFWALLRDGVDAISEQPDGRWVEPDDADGVAAAPRWGGYLSSVDTFDPQFFGIAPREAVGMDPQQRLFLEVCWEALEDAGIAPDALAGSATGVFAGISTNDYAALQTRGGDVSALGIHYASGIAHSIVSGRVSYLLGLNGPSVSLDTACSSSLVAVHQACHSLRNGETDLALAGGVNAILLPDNAIAFARSGMLAADGRCKSFDARADGFVRGEGCGVVALKRLSRAIADGDTVHAVIRGSAVNQDGASSGMTAPSGPAQESVIRTALKAANAQPRDVQWVEAHGTGTRLGDPIEVQAIAAALGAGRGRDEQILIGSVKSNLGHLEAAAGVAGLIKIVLSLRHGAIPRSLHFETPNPFIPWDRLPVRVVTELTPWARSANASRVAGVSSFGFGGTNAHLIVADAPEIGARPAAVERPSHVLAWSAASDAALRAVAGDYARHLAEHPEVAAADAAHTANVGRAQLRHRAALVFTNGDPMAADLRLFADTGNSPRVIATRVPSAETPRVVFMFTGQGSQQAGMGRLLYDTQPVFRQAIDACDAIVGDAIQPRLVDVLYPPPGATSPIDETAYTQPVLFALEYALATLWQSWGVRPAALIGHSLGEIVAATVAGVMTLEEALRLVVVRGRLGQLALADGAMAAIMATASGVEELIAPFGGAVSIAAFNAPENTVISGPKAAVDAAVAAAVSRGVTVKPILSTSAFHSPAADSMLAQFRAEASKIGYANHKIPIFANLYGRRASAGELSNADYWTRHVRQPVQFAASMASLVADGFTTFLEIGPHTTLLSLGRQSHGDATAAWLPSLRRGQNDWQVMLASLAHLYVRGAAVDWRAFDADYSRRRVRLPTYPFERRRYWVAERALVRVVPSPSVEAHARASEIFSHIEWIVEPERPLAAQSNEATLAGPWLVFVGADRVGDSIAAALCSAGAHVVVVRPGAAYERVGDGVALPPREPAAYRRLVDETRALAGRAVRGVVHCWALDRDLSDSDTLGDVRSIEERGVRSAFLLAQALATSGGAAAASLVLVTRGAQQGAAPAATSSTAPAAVAPAQAALWGFAASLRLEQPDMNCVAIDLDPAAPIAPEAIVARIAGQREPQVVSRGGRWLVPRLRSGAAPHMSMPETSPAANRIRADGSYLVTGGLGGLGLVAAEWLVERGAGHVALVSRGAPSEETLMRVARWNKAARRVSVHRGDVASREDVTRIVADLAANQPPLRGVFHAAGAVSEAPIDGGTWDSFAAALAPKVDGTWNLHLATLDAPLDFFLLYSSISAFTGVLGQANYAAANAFLVAFADYRRARGRPATSIEWGPWSDVGIAARNNSAKGLAAQGIDLLAPGDGMRAVEQVLGDDTPHAIVAAADWSRFAAQVAGRHLRASLFAELVGDRESASGGGASSPLGAERAQAPAVDLRAAPLALRWELLSERLRSLAARVLGIEAGSPIDEDRALQELGLDSLMAVELRDYIKAEFPSERAIPATLVFDYPSVRALTTFVASTLFGWEPRAANSRAEAPTSSAASARASDDLLDQLASLSPDEVERRLARRTSDGR